MPIEAFDLPATVMLLALMGGKLAGQLSSHVDDNLTVPSATDAGLLLLASQELAAIARWGRR